VIAELRHALKDMEDSATTARQDTKKARQSLRELEVAKAVTEELLESNQKLVGQIRQRALQQSQMLVDLQETFKKVLTESAHWKQLTAVLRRSQ